MGSGLRIMLRVKQPVPLGEVAVVPAPLNGRSEAEMARAMAAALADDELTSATDVYSRVQQAFPFAPLSTRLGALAVCRPTDLVHQHCQSAEARAQGRKREGLLDAAIHIGRGRQLIVSQSCGHGARHFGFRAAAERRWHDGYFPQWDRLFYP